MRPLLFWLRLVLYILMLVFLVLSLHKIYRIIKTPPNIYAITPTYARPEQQAQLTRLAHLFMLVPNLHWIIVEDNDENSILVQNVLKYAGLLKRSTQLHIETPTGDELQRHGVAQRNLALAWIRSKLHEDLLSVVYFMDDDYVYSIKLFQEIAKIEPGRIGVWPVGLAGGVVVERPMLYENQTMVMNFSSVALPERPFPIDIAGFGISTQLLYEHPLAIFTFQVSACCQESDFIRQLTRVNQLQPLANKCQDVLVWHMPVFLKEFIAFDD